MDADAAQHPWEESSRDRLPAGQTYLLGRDTIEEALVRAGARVQTLSLGRGHLPLRAGPSAVLDVYFYGDGRPLSFTPGIPRNQLLRMS